MQNRKYVISVTDRRYENLARLLAEDSKAVFTWGEHELEGFRRISTLFSLTSPINLILPFNTSCDEQLYALRSVPDGSAVFGGSLCALGERYVSEKSLSFINLLDDKTYTAANALPTAEGALAEAILRTEAVICGSEILILGYGAVARETAKLFIAAGAKVTVAARKKSALSDAEACGCGTAMLPLEAVRGYSVIINTIPASGILSNTLISKLDRDTLILELASGKNNIDRNACDASGIELIALPALPGRTAPATAAEYIRNAIERAEKQL